jgi:hypothetical protein
MEQELKPCPFCGGEAMEPWVAGWKFNLPETMCTGCAGDGSHAFISMPVSSWNARPATRPVPASDSELREALDDLRAQAEAYLAIREYGPEAEPVARNELRNAVQNAKVAIAAWNTRPATRRDALEEAAKVAEHYNFGPERTERDNARNAIAQIIANQIRALAKHGGCDE